jgi:carbon starvation protein
MSNQLLAALSIMILLLMVIVFIGAFSRWFELLHLKAPVVDRYGLKVLEVVQE